MPNSLTQTQLLAIVTVGAILVGLLSVAIDTAIRVARRLGYLA